MTKKEKNSEDWRALEGQANQLTRTILFIQKTIQPSVDILYNFNYYKLPRWRDLQNWLKLSILFRFILNSQEYVAFTLRFSKKKVTKALQGDIKNYQIIYVDDCLVIFIIAWGLFLLTYLEYILIIIVAFIYTELSKNVKMKKN